MPSIIDITVFNPYYYKYDSYHHYSYECFVCIVLSVDIISGTCTKYAHIINISSSLGYDNRIIMSDIIYCVVYAL